MGVLQNLQLTGAVTVGPVLPTGLTPSMTGAMDLSVQQVRAENRQTAMTINSVSPSFQDLLAGMSSTIAVRFCAIRVLSGTLVIRYSTPTASDQLVPVSDMWVVSNPAAGSEITRLAAQGQANIEIVISGDT